MLEMPSPALRSVTFSLIVIEVSLIFHIVGDISTIYFSMIVKL